MSQYNLHLSESDWAVIEANEFSAETDDEDAVHGVMEYTAWVDYQGKPKHIRLAERRARLAKAHRERMGINEPM